METILNSNGKLQERLMPAIYFDTTVLIEYWMTEGFEVELDEPIIPESPYMQVIRDILKSGKNFEKMVAIRKKLIYDSVRTTPVISPLALLELTKWYAESSFKDIASNAAGAKTIQKMSDKNIGLCLKKGLQLRAEELKHKENKSGESTGLERLVMETWLNRSFADSNGLSGLIQVEIINFNLSIDKAWQHSIYSYLQLYAADIIHILLAQHLGCKYFASFDSDFKTAKNILLEENKILVLSSPEEILAVL